MIYIGIIKQKFRLFKQQISAKILRVRGGNAKRCTECYAKSLLGESTFLPRFERRKSQTNKTYFRTPSCGTALGMLVQNRSLAYYSDRANVNQLANPCNPKQARGAGSSYSETSGFSALGPCLGAGWKISGQTDPSKNGFLEQATKCEHFRTKMAKKFVKNDMYSIVSYAFLNA